MKLLFYLAHKDIIPAEITLFLMRLCRMHSLKHIAGHPIRVVLRFYTSIALDLSVLHCEILY